jgi:hypothetical protein
MSRNRVIRLNLALLACYLLALPVCSGGGSSGGGVFIEGEGDACSGLPETPLGARDFRAIAGVSMGGYGALNLGTKHQDLFGTIGSMGGPVDLWQLLADIRDENLEVKPQAGPIPMVVGDDFTFDLLPPYPDRQTRIGFTKDLVLAFGNPLLHHPDPDFAFLASDSEPAMILMDDEWGTFTIPADPRGFFDGNDMDEDGLREVGVEDFANEPSDALLVANGTLSSVFGINDGTDIGGRMLKDDDSDGFYDIGDGIVVNLYEPFTDANGSGRFDAGEAFDDFGLDGVAATGDFGEGNGTFDEDPDIANWLAEDPLTRIAGMASDEICSQRIYMDAGDTDELGFLQHHQNVADELTGKGIPVDEIADDNDDDCLSFPSIDAPFTFLTYEGGHVGFDTDDLLDDLQNGNVCGATAIWQRLIHLVAAMDAAFPGGVDGIGGINPGDTITESIASPALAEGGVTPDRTVVIYRPPAFHNTNELLPIVYFLGGHGQKPEDYDRVNLLMDTLILAGRIQNMFMAFLPGDGGTEGSFYVNHVVPEAQVPQVPSPIEITSGRYEDSIVDDLIPEIENTLLAGRVR